MGDPKRSTNTWQKPAHPWQKTRIDQEKVYRRTYGLANKKEIWKMTSLLKRLKDQAKLLAAGSGSQVEREKQQLLKRAQRLGLITQNQGLDDVLGITPESVMERRLQTIVFKKGLARTVKQARQFIVHQHILLGESRITTPGYIVRTGEESRISFVEHSKLANPDHPERVKESTPVHTTGVDSATSETNTTPTGITTNITPTKTERPRERKSPSRDGARPRGRRESKH